MPVYSPRGLKIRLPVQNVFSLIQRLHPEANAYKVLQDIEIWDSISRIAGFSVGMVCFIMKLSFLQIALYTCLAIVLGKIYSYFPLIPIIFLRQIGIVYLKSPWILTYFVLPISIGIIFVGWQGVLAYYFACVISFAISFLTEGFYTLHLKSKNMLMTSSEMMFFKTYLLYAKQLNRSEILEVSEEDIETGQWKNALDEYATICPAMAERSLLESI